MKRAYTCFLSSTFRRTTLLLGLLTTLYTGFAQVGDPRLNVQGALKNSDGAAIPDGTKTMTFKLYHDGAGGTAQWQETAEVTVTGGVYNYNLGSTTPIDLDVFSQRVYLGVTVDGTELTPRVELTSAPYALHAHSATTAVSLTGCKGAVGDVKYSILPLDQFRQENGDCWVLMNGAGLSSDTKLNAAYGVAELPDARGLFLRAHDDRNSNRQDPSRSADTPPGTYVGDEIRSHNHSMQAAGNHTHTGAFNEVSIDWRSGGDDSMGNGTGNDDNETSMNGSHTHTINHTGGAETRPKSINLYVYIRIN